MLLRLLICLNLMIMSACSLKNGDDNSNDDDKKNKKEKDSEVTTECDSSSHDNSAPSFRVKGTTLLAQTLEYTLGPGKTKNINGPDDLLETYGSNFGNTNGLSFGDLYADQVSADSSMTAYIMSLNIIAYNAALHCAVSDKDPMCLCATPDDAMAMLARAMPYYNFCDVESKLVQEFTEVCKESRRDAITALISSMAFALRN